MPDFTSCSTKGSRLDQERERPATARAGPGVLLREPISTWPRSSSPVDELTARGSIFRVPGPDWRCASRGGFAEEDLHARPGWPGDLVRERREVDPLAVPARHPDDVVADPHPLENVRSACERDARQGNRLVERQVRS